jgi:hypothetical protein
MFRVQRRAFSLRFKVDNNNLKDIKDSFSYDVNYRVNIEGINRNALIKGLWDGAKPADYFCIHGIKPQAFDLEEAKRIANKREGSIEYLFGKAIGVNIDCEWVDPRIYNRFNGKFKFEEIVSKLEKH